MEKTKEISLTEQEWLGIKSIADDFGLSVGEFLAKLSSKKLLVMDSKVREDELDLQEALLTLAQAQKTGEEPMLWEDFEVELNNNEISN